MGNVSLINGHIDEPMTDNEIINALRGCEGCHYFNECAKSTRLALDLINRQQAEIENYKQIAENQQSVSMDKEVKIRRLKAEVERLKYNLEAVLQERADHSEAVKEFAERLCEGRVSNDPVVIAVKVELEMVGEDK